MWALRAVDGAHDKCTFFYYIIIIIIIIIIMYFYI